MFPINLFMLVVVSTILNFCCPNFFFWQCRTVYYWNLYKTNRNIRKNLWLFWFWQVDCVAVFPYILYLGSWTIQMANNSAVRGSSRWTNNRKAIRLADKELENICQSVRFNVPLSLNVNSNEDSVQVISKT